jgi:hypothetical protein
MSLPGFAFLSLPQITVNPECYLDSMFYSSQGIQMVLLVKLFNDSVYLEYWIR